MPTRVVFDYDLNTGPGTKPDFYVEFGPGDYSWYDELRSVLILTKAGAAVAGNTLDVFIQCRDRSGVWEDRGRHAQFLGTAVVSPTAPEEHILNIQQFGTLAPEEEATEPSGSEGGLRLAAGFVKNGAFPGRYRIKGVGPGASWRVQVKVVDGANNADFEGKIIVEGNYAG